MLLATRLSAETPRKGCFSFYGACAVVGVSLLVLSWLTTEHFLPWVSWHSEMPVFLAVALLAIAALARVARNGGTSRVQVPAICIPFAALAAIALAQWAGGRMAYSGDTVVFDFYMALCIGCAMLGFNAREDVPARGWAHVDVLAFAFVAGSAASVLVAFAQVFDLWANSPWISQWIARMPDFRRPGANIGQPNQLATLILMGMASLAYLHLAGKIAAKIAVPILLILAAGLAVTESRTGALALLMTVSWWQFKRPVIAAKTWAWSGLSLAAVYLAMFAAWPRLLNALLLDVAAESRLGNGDVRIAMWSQLVQAILQRPWSGWGILQTAQAHNAVAADHRVNNAFSYSHNVFIDFAVWMGLPIAVVLAGIVARWLWSRARSVRQLTPWYCIALAIPLLVHSLLEFPFAYAYFLAPVLFLFGVLERSIGSRPVMSIRPLPTLVLTVSVGAAMLWSVAEYLKIEEEFRFVRFEQLRIGRTPPDHERPNVAVLTQLDALLTGSRIELRPDMPLGELEQLRKLALRYPWVNTQYRYALALALNRQQAEAVRQLQVMRWQRGEKLYARIKRDYAELGQTRYPQLLSMKLP